MRLGVLSLSLCACLAACAAPMAMRDIEAVRPNCASVDRQIAALEQEKAKNDNRLIAGVSTVAPALALINLAQDTYATNASIATGEWARAIDAKLAQLRRAKASCRRKA